MGTGAERKNALTQGAQGNTEDCELAPRGASRNGEHGTASTLEGVLQVAAFAACLGARLVQMVFFIGRLFEAKLL